LFGTEIGLTRPIRRGMVGSLRSGRRAGSRFPHYGISIMTEPSCSLTLYVLTFKVGMTVKEPVRTSNLHPCHGQVTTEPVRFPSPKGPPRCRHTFAKAKYSFLTRNRAMLLPSDFDEPYQPDSRSPSYPIWCFPLTSTISRGSDGATRFLV
jgi:hypothetical protein